MPRGERIKKRNRLKLWDATMAVFLTNHTDCTSTVCRQNSELLKVALAV